MLAEAMAAGVPVVASNVGGIPDVVGRAGLLVPREDPVALASAIGAVLRDPARRASMIKQGLEDASRFDWVRTANRIAHNYERLKAAA
jgi:glycosyltransferase involved in cell wall biosynthesis